MKDYSLKPCPFCGRKPKIDSEFYEELTKENGSARISIKCGCGSELAIYSFQYPEEARSLEAMTDEVVKKWNERPLEKDLDRSNEDLYAEVRELEGNLKAVSEEAHEYLAKWTQALKRNEILNRVIILNEIARTCPDLAAEYKQEATK